LQTVKFHGSEWPAEVFEDARRFLASEGLPATMLATALQLKMWEHSNATA
jgi:hypothetical protein